MAYYITLCIFCAAYGLGIAGMGFMRKHARWNLAFMAVVYISYLLLSWTVYRDVGFWDWNYQNTLPTANVSPFMFSLMPLLLVMPRRMKKAVHLLIALLSVGMFLSGALGCVYYGVIHYAFHHHFLLDFGAHFALSLFGVYLVRSGQVELKVRNCIISGAIIVGVALCMLVLNCIFDTAFFGLSIMGKHNIYNNVLVENGAVSAAVYFAGLVLVLLLGAGYCKIFEKKQKTAT